MRRRYLFLDASDPSAASPRELGGKGFNLLRLRSLGLPVPRFLIVTRRAFDEAVGRCPGLRERLATLEGAAPDELAATAARIADAIQTAGCPGWLGQELGAALERAGLHGARLAVRSSVVGEDSAEHSFAGIMDTRLNVAACEAPRALAHVWASAFSARALAYRQRKGLDLEGITTAVVVQEMLSPASSGVLFTRDPEPAQEAAGSALEPPRRCVISAAYGLGEGVVRGAVETDTYRIAWDCERVARELGVKASRLVAARRGGTTSEEIPPHQRRAAVLTDIQVRQLRDLGVTLERAQGSAQDVEWAFDDAGRLFVLQARPIVPAAVRRTSSQPGDRRVWDNSNIIESYPGLTLPLTFSFVRNAYEQAFRRAATAFFPIANPLAARPHLFKSLVGLLHGRVYYNLLNWYEMFSCLSRPESHRKSWDRMVGVGDHDARLGALRRPLGTRLMAALGALRVLLGVRGLARRFRSEFEAFHSRHRDAAEAPEASQLAIRFRRIEHEAARFWHLTLFTDLCAMRYYEWLAALAARWAPDAPDLGNRLLAGEPGVESVAPVRRLVAIAERVRKEPCWQELLLQNDDDGVWHALLHQPRFAPLRDAVDAYLEAFGDRGVEELKLETPTFRERPERVITLLRRYAVAGLSVRTMQEREIVTRRDAEQAAAQRVRGWRRLVFRWVLARAREAIRNRENMRFARSRLFGIVRRVFRRLGERLVAAGALARASDVFYLTTEEVLGFVEATTVTTDLRALVELRRREYAGFARCDPADRFETAGLPPLAAQDQPRTVQGVGRVLAGIGCSAGVATGTARIVLDPVAASAGRRDVLVARSTDPGWVFLMMSSSGIVAERGSPLSHTAIIGRELGIPTVVGVSGATARIPDGAQLRIDGSTGHVEWA